MGGIAWYFDENALDELCLERRDRTWSVGEMVTSPIERRTMPSIWVRSRKQNCTIECELEGREKHVLIVALGHSGAVDGHVYVTTYPPPL